MKKLLLASVIAGVITSSVAFGAVTGCMDKNAYTFDPLATINDKALCKYHSNGDPMAVTQAWGLTGYQTPKATCKVGNYVQQCQDISGTDYFKNSLRKVPYMVAILKGLGLLPQNYSL